MAVEVAQVVERWRFVTVVQVQIPGRALFFLQGRCKPILTRHQHEDVFAWCHTSSRTTTYLFYPLSCFLSSVYEVVVKTHHLYAMYVST